MRKFIHATLLITAALSVTGCSPRLGGHDYAVRGVGEVSRTVRGVIIAARPVKISGSPTSETDNQPGAGAVIGGVSGAALGSTLGRGRGQVVGGVLGGLAGAAAGHYIGRAATDQEGFEYQIKLDSGEIVTVAQGAEPALKPGDRVMVIYGSRDRSRVVLDTTGSR